MVATAGTGAVREAVTGTLELATGTRRAGSRAASPARGRRSSARPTRSSARRSGSSARDLDAFLAALDPEPLAAELDAFVDAALARLPALIGRARATSSSGR